MFECEVLTGHKYPLLPELLQFPAHKDTDFYVAVCDQNLNLVYTLKVLRIHLDFWYIVIRED